MSSVSFKSSRLPPVRSVFLRLPPAGHVLGDLYTASLLTVMTPPRDTNFYPHYADKETEARVLLPKSRELIRGRAGTQTKLVTLPSELRTITTLGPASPGCTGKSPGRFLRKLYPQVLI